MKRALCWIMSVILLLNSCPPAFAAACNFESMLKDSYDPGWMNMECVRDFACYCREKNRKTNYCVFKGEVERGYKRFTEKFDKPYVLDADTAEDQSKVDRYHIAKVSFILTFPRLRPIDKSTGEPFSRDELIRWDFCSKTLQEKVQDKVDKKEKSVSFCFGSGEETSVLNSKIKRLAEMDEESLKSAISTLVTRGSNKPGDPTYVHPLIFEAAFAFLAQKLTNSNTSSISRYLHSANLRVQWSAANALATYAVGPNNPEGKFTLEDTEKAQITRLFNDALLLLPQNRREGSFLYRHIVARLGNIYRNPITDSGLQYTLSAPQQNNSQFAAAVGVLSVPFATAEAAGVAAADFTAAAMESASVAPVAFAVGATLIIFYALNSAFNVGFRIKFKNAREKFWGSVFSPKVDFPVEIYPLDDVEPEEAMMRFVTVWTPDMAKLGDLTDMAIVTQTKKKKKPTCKYIASPAGSPWRLDKLHEYVNTGDPRSLAQLNSVRRCLGRYSFCPTDVADEKRPFMGCKAISLSSIGGSIPCSRDLKQLERVYEVASSFYDADSGDKLFTRAIYKENIQFIGQVQIGVPGRWIPEAEIGIRFENPIEDISRMFIQEIQDAIKQQLYGSIENISNTFSLGNYRSFRRGDHERNTKYRWNSQEKYFDKKQTDKPYQHFHYEEFLTYPTKNPYICNHSIYYPANQ